MRKNFSQRNR